MTYSCGQVQPMAGEAAAGPSREHVSVCKYVVMAVKVDSVFVRASVHKTHDDQWILTNTHNTVQCDERWGKRTGGRMDQRYKIERLINYNY